MNSQAPKQRHLHSVLTPDGDDEPGAVLNSAIRDLISVQGPETVDATLELIVAGAVASLPQVERAGISYVEPDGTVTARTPSDDVVAELDALQNTLGQGPCLDAVRGGRRVMIGDMSVDGLERWPLFAPVAVQRNILSMCSLTLFARLDGTAGALNLYGGNADIFDDAGLIAAGVFASHAAVALHGAQRVAKMTTALANRDMIGRAKGILIERFDIDDDAAFAMLVRSSQHTNLKLHAVAEWLVNDATTKHRRPT